MDKYPAFTSYGKATFLFFGEYRDFGGVIGFWFPKKEPAYNSKGLEHDIQRHLYFLDPHYFENAQVAQLKPRYESASLFSFDSKCPYAGLFIIFAIIDFLLILILIGLIIAKRLGSKKMKLQLQKNQRRGIAKPSTFYGKTTVATTTTVQPSTVQPSTITTDGGKGGGTIAPTNLNTQFTTTATKSGETTETKTTNVKANGINTATINTVTKQQTTTQISAESATPIQTTKTGK
uniref:Uncharacterized protein n=1 Tax=Panagrolaimus davidi TaxID=227884 RepID=A0A914QHT5_9BILA